jgi:hypothetical protein
MEYSDTARLLFPALEPWIVKGLGLGVRARVFNTAATTLTTGVTATLSFDSERYDTDSIHDTAINPSRLTCQTPGLYSITGHVRFASNATGIREISILINGSVVIAIQDVPALNGAVTIMSISTQYELALSDYVELRAFQNSGGNLNVDVAANYSPEFGMCRVA